MFVSVSDRESFLCVISAGVSEPAGPGLVP